jgi:glycosyltransferase involved in cell wall biosynthesis
LVSAIIPARNEEASIARAVESVAAQAEIEEVIVINDQSTDGTASILTELSERVAKLKILTTGELPTGWTGKNYAVSIGAAAAKGDWLLFTDADTYHLPGAARRALDDAAEHDAVLVSYSPEQELGTLWERAMIPFVYWRLSKHYSYARVNDRATPDAAANGQFLVVQRDAYDGVGGHSAIAGEILEDVALAKRVKRAGGTIYFAPGYGIVRTRMYRDFRAMWQGWTKNLYPLIGGTAGSLAIEIVEVLPVFQMAVFILLWLYLSHSYGLSVLWLPLFLLSTIAERQLAYALELRRNLYPASYIQYYALGMCLYAAALVVSWWRNTFGRVEWKGRAYPSRTP